MLSNVTYVEETVDKYDFESLFRSDLRELGTKRTDVKVIGVLIIAMKC